MRRLGYVLAAAVVIAVVVLFPSDKKRVRKVIGACKQAVVNEDPGGVMEHVSLNYAGGYLALKKRVERVFNAYDDFEVTAVISGITVEGDRAEAFLGASLVASAGNERGYLLGDAGAHREIKVYFEKEKFGWKIVRVGFVEGKEEHRLRSNVTGRPVGRPGSRLFLTLRLFTGTYNIKDLKV